MSNRRRAAKARQAKRGRPYNRAPEARRRREYLESGRAQGLLPQCGPCFKISYPSEGAAEAAMRAGRGRKAYPCPEDPSVWHLSHQG